MEKDPRIRRQIVMPGYVLTKADLPYILRPEPERKKSLVLTSSRTRNFRKSSSEPKKTRAEDRPATIPPVYKVDPIAEALRLEGMVPQLTHKIAEVKDTEPLKQKQSRLKFQFEYKVRHLTREEQAAYWHARETPFRSGKMDRIGLDIGTKNIVLAYRKDNKLSFRREVNGFVSITKGDNFTKQMLVQAGVPYIEREKDFIAIGEKAENLAFAFGKELQRPMVDGVLSVTERQAMGIMASSSSRSSARSTTTRPCATASLPTRLTKKSTSNSTRRSRRRSSRAST